MKGSSSKPRQNFQVRNYDQKKTFKKKILKADILNEARERQHFIKKSEKKRLSKAAGKQRWLRKLRETPGVHNYNKNYRKKTGR